MLQISSNKFIYFDEKGELLSVSNTNAEEGNWIEVDIDAVKDILDAKDSMTNYSVAFDSTTKKYELKHKLIAVDFNTDIWYDIFEIPFIEQADVVVTQDCKNKEWIFELDPAIVKETKSKDSFYNFPMQFSITEFNDPHNLLQFIKFGFRDLIEENKVKVAFDDNFKVDKTDISVYTIKKFDTYCRRTVNEQI